MVIHKQTHFLATLGWNGCETIPVTKLCKTGILVLPTECLYSLVKQPFGARTFVLCPFVSEQHSMSPCSR